MQGEALIKIGNILETIAIANKKMSNDISILKNNSVENKSRSRSRSAKKPILRSTSQKRRNYSRNSVNHSRNSVNHNKKTKKSSTKKSKNKRKK